MRPAPGLPASPPVRYMLGVAERGALPPLVRCGRTSLCDVAARCVRRHYGRAKISGRPTDAADRTRSSSPSSAKAARTSSGDARIWADIRTGRARVVRPFARGPTRMSPDSLPVWSRAALWGALAREWAARRSDRGHDHAARPWEHRARHGLRGRCAPGHRLDPTHRICTGACRNPAHDGRPPVIAGILDALSGGILLAMAVETMIPEAFHEAPAFQRDRRRAGVHHHCRCRCSGKPVPLSRVSSRDIHGTVRRKWRFHEQREEPPDSCRIRLTPAAAL